jgi:hypothetical protein
MLKIYICPECYNFRMVSRKPDAICFHCGTVLEHCDIEYATYMNMTEDERENYRNNYKKRILHYNNKLTTLLRCDNHLK